MSVQRFCLNQQTMWPAILNRQTVQTSPNPTRRQTVRLKKHSRPVRFHDNRAAESNNQSACKRPLFSNQTHYASRKREERHKTSTTLWTKTTLTGFSYRQKERKESIIITLVRLNQRQCLVVFALSTPIHPIHNWILISDVCCWSQMEANSCSVFLGDSHYQKK